MISYIFSMKVTALIPDDLISDVRELSEGKNLTESLIRALKEWTSLQHLRILKNKVRKEPLEFASGFSAQHIREINRS